MSTWMNQRELSRFEWQSTDEAYRRSTLTMALRPMCQRPKVLIGQSKSGKVSPRVLETKNGRSHQDQENQEFHEPRQLHYMPPWFGTHCWTNLDQFTPLARYCCVLSYFLCFILFHFVFCWCYYLVHLGLYHACNLLFVAYILANPPYHNCIVLHFIISSQSTSL